MKRLLLLILIIFSFCKVEAISIGEPVGAIKYDRCGIGSYNFESDGESPKGFQYRRHYIDYNSRTDVYCISPGLKDPQSMVKVVNIFGRNDVNYASLIDGLLAIEKSFNTGTNGMPNTAEEYVATVLSIRSFVYLFANNTNANIYNMTKAGTNFDGYNATMVYFRNMVSKYNAKMKSAVGITGAIKGVDNSATGVYGVKNKNTNQNFVDIAEKKLVAGLDAAIKTRNNYANNNFSIGAATLTKSTDGNVVSAVIKVVMPDYSDDVYFKVDCEKCGSSVVYKNHVSLSSSPTSGFSKVNYTDSGINLGKKSRTVYVKIDFTKATMGECPVFDYRTSLNTKTGLALLEYADDYMGTTSGSYYQEYVCSAKGGFKEIIMGSRNSSTKLPINNCEKNGQTIYRNPQATGYSYTNTSHRCFNTNRCNTYISTGVWNSWRYYFTDIYCKNINPSTVCARIESSWTYQVRKCEVSGVQFVKGSLVNKQGSNESCNSANDLGNKKYEKVNNVASNSNYGNQHFIMIVKSANSDVLLYEKKQAKIEFCGTCSQFETACRNSGNSNSVACKNFNSMYGGSCGECTTQITNNDCSTANQNYKIVEGLLKEGNSCPSANPSNKNVKKCIIDKKDVNGNSYHATTSSYPNNSYCKVYCTEDYEMNMPGIQETISGRSFNLQGNLKGTKSCYTNEINYEQFRKDAKAAQDDLLEKYNKYLYWREAYYDKIESSEFTGNSHCGGGTYYDYFVSFSYQEVSISYNKEGFAHSISSSTLEGSERSNGSRGSSSCCYDSCKTYSEEKGCRGGCTCARHCSSSPYSGSSSALRNRIVSNYNSSKSSLTSAINSYRSIVSEFNSCGSNVSKTSYFNKSSIWNENYKFNPRLAYWYEDNYMSIIKDRYFDTSVSNGRLNISVCSGTVDDSFKTCSDGWRSNSGKTATTSSFGCTGSGNNITCSIVPLEYTTAKYTKQSITSSASFNLPTQFYTLYPSGKVVNEENVGANPLEKRLPISLNTKSGVYNYSIYAENIGEYYNSTSKLGRVWGNTNSTFKDSLDKNNSCYKSGALVASDRNGEQSYTCAYRVNCPNCTVTCPPTSSCYWRNCPGNNCATDCKNCIYNNNDVNFVYRTITNKNVNPTNRNLGYNWSYPANNITTKTQMKACVTSTDIINKGDKVYSNDSDDIVLKVDLNQSLIREINRYNEANQDQGGFANDSLSCYSYKYNSKTYNNVFCYSKFIDEMLTVNGGEFKNNFKFTNNRILSENQRNSSTNQCTGNNCYWNVWNNELASNNISVSTCRRKITGAVSNYYFSGSNDVIGPSYK